MALREHDHRERDAGGREVADGDHRRSSSAGTACARRRRALRGDRVARRRLALLLEARAHEEQRDGREGVRHRVGEERHPARDPEERAARSAARESAPSRARACDRLAASASCASGTTARNAPLLPARKKTPEVESTNATTRISQSVAWCSDHRGGERADRGRADGVGDDHQHPPVEAVGGDAGREVEQQHRPEHDRADVARLLPPSA